MSVHAESAKRTWYIVGGGSFARKVYAILTPFASRLSFIDEFASAPLLGAPVLRAADLSSPVESDALVVFAISDVEHCEAAQARLAHCFAKHQALLLRNDSDAWLLQHMLTIDLARCLALFAPADTHCQQLERLFFADREQFCKEFATQHNSIAFYALGRSGGFLSHLGTLPQQTAQSGYPCALFSDMPSDIPSDMPKFLMSQSQMQAGSIADLVITAHHHPCVPAQQKLLSFCHMVFDFMIFERQALQHLQQADTHYIVMPSAAAMRYYQNLCRAHQLTQRIVLIPGGYPKHDVNMRRYASLQETKNQTTNHEAAPDNDTVTLLYAPTLSSVAGDNEMTEGFSIEDAPAILAALLTNHLNLRVIFRPHPEDLALTQLSATTARAQAVLDTCKLIDIHPRASLDKSSQHYLESFLQADLLLTDTSTIGFSFALITHKPVLFYARDHAVLEAHYPDNGFLAARHTFGQCVSHMSQISCAISAVHSQEIEARAANKAALSEYLYQPGISESYMLDALPRILADDVAPNWWQWHGHERVPEPAQEQAHKHG